MKIKWPGLTDGDKGRWVPRGEGEVNGSVGVKWAGEAASMLCELKRAFFFFFTSRSRINKHILHSVSYRRFYYRRGERASGNTE